MLLGFRNRYLTIDHTGAELGLLPILVAELDPELRGKRFSGLPGKEERVSRFFPLEAANECFTIFSV